MVCSFRIPIFAALAALAVAEQPGVAPEVLATDDECLASDGVDCALNAVQLRAKAKTASEEAAKEDEGSQEKQWPFVIPGMNGATGWGAPPGGMHGMPPGGMSGMPPGGMPGAPMTKSAQCCMCKSRNEVSTHYAHDGHCNCKGSSTPFKNTAAGQLCMTDNDGTACLMDCTKKLLSAADFESEGNCRWDTEIPGKALGTRPFTVIMEQTPGTPHWSGARQWLLTLGQAGSGGDHWTWRGGSHIQFGVWGVEQAQATDADISQAHCIAQVFDGHDLKLYIDGKLANKVSAAGRLNIRTNSLSVGKPGMPGEMEYSGCVHSVQVFRKALSATQIAQRFRDVKQSQATMPWWLR